MMNENAIDSIQNALEVGDQFLTPSYGDCESRLKVRILYEGDYFWLAESGTIPFTPLLLGNIPFLIRKEDGAIIHELHFVDYTHTWELLEDAQANNLILDTQLIHALKHELPSWETDDPVVLPRPSGFRQDIKDLILFFKNLFFPKT